MFSHRAPSASTTHYEQRHHGTSARHRRARPEAGVHHPVARPPSDRPQVVVIGGGFAGLEATKKFKGENVDVTLIDRSNHHLFQPLLYQVATAGLTPANIARPLREIFRHQENVEVILSEVRRVDTAARKVITEDLVVPYDFLILATRSAPQLLRPRRMGKVRARPEKPGRRRRNPQAAAYSLRGRGKSRRSGRTRRGDDLRHRRRRPDWRRNGGSHQRDRPAHDDARFPLHQFRPGEDYHHRGSAAHSLGASRRSFRSAAKSSWSRSE